MMSERNDSFKNRLAEALKYRKMSQTDLSLKTGLSLSLIGKYLKGDTEAGNTKLLTLSKALGVSVIWLMGYDTPMIESSGVKTDGDTIQIKLKPLQKMRLNETQITELLDRYIQLTEEQQKLINEILKQFVMLNK